MRISDLLSADAIIFADRYERRENILRDLIEALSRMRGVNAEIALAEINARERLGSTLLTAGKYCVAMPHAVGKSCRQLSVGLAVARHGIIWSEEKAQANIVFLVIAPAEAQALYLRVISRIAHLCQTPQAIDDLLNAQNAAEIISRISSYEEHWPLLPKAVDAPKFCVIGAGHGGLAMAGHLSLLGYEVNLLNRTLARIAAVRERGGIAVEGEIKGFAPLRVVTTDPAEALEETDVIMVVVPATAHRSVMEMVAPHLRDGQIVVLNPGRTGGALEASHVLRERNANVKPYIAEAQTLLYASRSTNPGQVHIFSIKNSVPLATLPAYHVVDILPIIRQALPQFVPGADVLTTSFDNIGAVFHPAITILNAGRIEDTHGDFQYYIEGVTPSVAAVLEAIDAERVAVASALGIRANTAREWLYLAYDAAGRTLFDAIRANQGYYGIKAPAVIQHRYIAEDVPASLVPIASIGEMLGVPTPAIRAVINLASIMHGIDYWREGRTVDRLGIRGMSIKDIRLFVVGAETAPAVVATPSSVEKGT